ncbi:MAG: histidine kinase [Pseudomonadota bacterium]
MVEHARARLKSLARALLFPQFLSLAMYKPLLHHRYALAGLLFCLVVGISILVSPYLAGPAYVNLDKPLAHLARLLLSVATGAAPLERSVRLVDWLRLGEATLLSLYIALFWYGLRARSPSAAWRTEAALVGQGLAGVLLDSLPLDLLCAAQLGALLPWRRGLGWLAALYLAGIASVIALLAASLAERSTALELALLGSLSIERLVLVLGFGVAVLVRAEQRSRMALASANAELHATQALLSDTVRASERLRIARDLHDAAGHHLTALKLHLDLAQRQSDGKASASLSTANLLVSELLSEVRTVVSSERRDADIDLKAALASLCAGIPHPQVRLDMDAGIVIRSAAAAHTLFNCVREAITNAVRHADADLVTVSLRVHGDEFQLCVTDNGRGSTGSEGNGLGGMRERLEQQGGSLRARSVATGGFALDIAIPGAGALA